MSISGSAATAILIAAIALPSACADEPAWAPLLARVRQKVAEDAKSIPRYVCRQRIERHTWFVKSSGGGCAAIMEQRTRKGHRSPRFISFDRASLDVMLSGGREFFSWPGEHNFESHDPGQLLGGGMSGNGDFANFLIDIFGHATKFSYRVSCPGGACVEFDYEVPQDASGYIVRTEAGAFKVAYEGVFDVDPASASLLRLTVHVLYPEEIPSVCDVHTSIVYQRAGDAGFMLPESTEEDAVAISGLYMQNKVSYAGCRQYSTESVLKFGGDVDAVAAHSNARTSPPPMPPAGTELTLRLASKIDSDVNWAGDPIEATLVKLVSGGEGHAAIPAGTVFLGHITRLQRSFEPAVIVKVQFDWMLLGGDKVPVALDPVPRRRMLDGGFVYPVRRTIVDKGVVWLWRVRPTTTNEVDPKRLPVK